MLYELGHQTIEQMTEKAIPQGILSTDFLAEEEGPRGEHEVLRELETMASENEVWRSYIGCGYYNTVTPKVIVRNVLENPSWYTPYTPYQAEISQGRMEALLNFQTMVSDLTGMQYANASLLDEGTAAAEAMQVCMALSHVKEPNILVSSNCHPQVISVIQTRAHARGYTAIVSNPSTFDVQKTPIRGMILAYPDTVGEIEDFSPIIDKAKESGALTVICTDLLACTQIVPPGELGADIAVGSAQRFGVPLGSGGPHAAFFATSNPRVLRRMPGRIIGVSRDVNGNPAMRLALQTREQHIRRERATSNICTAQALLANMASFYAIYHGPEEGLRRMGHTVRNSLFFDTLNVRHKSKTAHIVIGDASTKKINLRLLDGRHVGISLDETVTTKDVDELLEIFHEGDEPLLDCDMLTSEVVSAIQLSHLARKSKFLEHPIFQICRSEHEMLRYIYKLHNKDLSLTRSMIPLGSCTMKLNATSEMIPITWDKFASIHPFVPMKQMMGFHGVFADLDRTLSDLTGFSQISFQPNSGSQGEFTGLRIIREYQSQCGEGHRNVCLIPESAHGTNPASAVMAGMKVVLVRCTDNGYLDLQHLRELSEKHAEHLSAFMVTYPSTYGIFEESIQGACAIVHQFGGQVYLDGANMNAMVGLIRPADLGADVCHLNLHKTFCIPHGGGGPGMGPIGVADHLSPFLPSHFSTVVGGRQSMGSVSSAPFSSASILPITWMYLKMMGSAGLRFASQVAILNANYMKKRLQEHYSIRYTSNTGYCAHEFIIDLKQFKHVDIEATDIAKRLMDYNFHAPTMSWPVPNSMMIEPTETESKEELDRFCDAMISIREEIDDIIEGRQPKDNNLLKNSPHTQFVVCSDEWTMPYTREKAAYPLPWVREAKFWPAVGRVDSVYGDRHLQCSCPPLSSYADDVD